MSDNKCIYYNRISTDNKDQNPQSNFETSKAYIDRNNLTLINSYIDRGVSGSVPLQNREQGKLLLEEVNYYIDKKEQISIIVFSIDRLTREDPIDSMTLLRNLRNKGVEIISVSESIFSESSEFSQPLEFNILWFNHYFLQQHSKKVKAGIQKRKSEGKNIGRSLIKETRGTGKNKKNIYYTPEEIEQINNTIIELNKSMSYREIKNKLNEKNINVSIGYISSVINNNS
ncbi:MAG: recombinase family protein [Atribacterota bacterium]